MIINFLSDFVCGDIYILKIGCREEYVEITENK
jgi:hypothetical protein